MKFGVICDVEGKTYLENGLTIEHDKMRYIFYITDEGLLKQIRIISNVDDPEKYFYYKSPVKEDGTYTVNYSFEEHVKDNLIRELQRLESILALIGNIKRVYWNKPTFEYYAETEAEHSRINILPAWFFLHEISTDDSKLITASNLIQLVGDKDLFQPLVVPMSFFREAKSEYSSHRYINAFFNSYFIIEGLFGNNKFKSDAVIRELIKSAVFTSFVKKFLDKIGKNDKPDEGLTKSQLVAELKTRGQDYTVEGLIKLIVKTRGELHHFTFESNKSQGTPFNNIKYKTISLITFTLAGNVLIHYMKAHKT